MFDPITASPDQMTKRISDLIEDYTRALDVGHELDMLKHSENEVLIRDLMLKLNDINRELDEVEALWAIHQFNCIHALN